MCEFVFVFLSMLMFFIAGIKIKIWDGQVFAWIQAHKRVVEMRCGFYKSQHPIASSDIKINSRMKKIATTTTNDIKVYILS